ncbi:MAG: hypothetical protein KGL11_15115 [Alphaproteobacteria bacterium]|nr:hypothetical protein [Alphaproteobacteria bacterium]
MIEVSRCNAQTRSPVVFRIDCSHVKDAAVRSACARFIENQACRVFPAYRKITGIALEKTCRTITYTIYDADNFPHPKGDGGVALRCAVDYIADYSLKFRADSKLGAYDVHELLHLYHSTLGALPATHILFGPSMTEAMLVIGDGAGYRQRLAQLKQETPRLAEALRRNAEKSAKTCVLAEIETEQSLYLADRTSVYRFYRDLVTSRLKDQADRERRFARMYVAASGGKNSVRQYLLDHGCPAM